MLLERAVFYLGEFQLEDLLDRGVKQIILEEYHLSRLGKFDVSIINEMSKKISNAGAKAYLEWNTLMTEEEFERSIKTFSSLDLSSIDSFRVADVGAFQYLLDQDDLFFHFIAEHGNHNLDSLKGWKREGKQRMKRLVLSSEIPKDSILSYSKRIDCEFEILVLGPLQIFYSPRHLLDPLLEERSDQKLGYISALANSQESPHKGFPIIQNQHGTHMFHIKDQFLLGNLDDILEENIHYRVDLRFTPSLDLLDRVIEIFKGVKSDTNTLTRELKNLYEDHYGRQLTKGYFNVNKSDAIFKKLKNQEIKRVDENYLGEVVESVKGSYLLISLKNPKIILSKGDELLFINPEGKKIRAKVYDLKSTDLVDLESVGAGEYVIINFVKGAWVKSQIYLN
jgi:putative protease